MAVPREIDGQADGDDDDGRTQIRLGHHEPRDERDEGGERDHHGRRADAVAAGPQPEREIEDERQLRQLGGLEPDERREPQPARRAAGGRADPRDEHGSEQRHHEDDQRQRHLPVVPVLDAGGREQADQADGRPHGLLHQEVARVVAGVEGADPARAVHHREPDREEREHDAEQRKVVLGRPRHRHRRPPHEAKARTRSRNRSPRSA